MPRLRNLGRRIVEAIAPRSQAVSAGRSATPDFGGLATSVAGYNPLSKPAQQPF
jgi:hypothetical protein